jgi:hypothetical protein
MSDKVYFQTNIGFNIIETEDQYVMTGGGYGNHSLAKEFTDVLRLMTHFAGYLENNGFRNVAAEIRHNYH